MVVRALVTTPFAFAKQYKENAIQTIIIIITTTDDDTDYGHHR